MQECLNCEMPQLSIYGQKS